MPSTSKKAPVAFTVGHHAVIGGRVRQAVRGPGRLAAPRTRRGIAGARLRLRKMLANNPPIADGRKPEAQGGAKEISMV